MDQTLLQQVAQQVQQKTYGKYRGFVADNNDVDHMGRLRLTVPSLLGEQVTGWALPCVPFGGLTDQGWLILPEIDAQVWVEFEEGELSRPIWTGTFWQQPDDIPVEARNAQPYTRLLKTPSGHVLQFDDESGAEKFHLIHPAGAEILIDENGTISLTDAGGATVVLDADAGEIRIEDANGNTLIMNSGGTTVEDASGNKVEMAAAGVTVQGQKIVLSGSQVALAGEGGEPLIKGTSFMTLFNTHTHVSSPTGGPTSPPAVPMTPGQLSLKVTTS